MDNDQKNTFDIVDEDINHQRIDESKVGDNFDWKAEALRLDGLNARRATKLAKVKESFTKKQETTPSPAGDQGNKKFDYGQLAYLTANNVTHPEDQAYIRSIMDKTGAELLDVVGDEFVMGRLKANAEKRASKEAIPDSDGRNAPPAKDQVDYWLNKGELPPPEQRELRQKVVNARIKKEGSGSPFTSNSVVGRLN